MKHLKQNAGFSIIEMLTVIALLSVLTTVGVSALFKVTDGWKISKNTMDLQDTAEDVFEELERDFGHVLSQQLAGASLRGIVGNYQVEQPGPFYRLNLENDRIELPIQEIDPATGAVNTQMIAYEIDRGGDFPRLTRYVGAIGGAAPAAATGAWDYVLGLRIEYFDGEAWLDNWAQDKLPEGVGVSVTIMDDVNPDEQIARRATFPIHVD